MFGSFTFGEWKVLNQWASAIDRPFRKAQGLTKVAESHRFVASPK